MGYGYATAVEGVTPTVNESLIAGITDSAPTAFVTRINEIMLGGEATASAVNRYALRRATTVGSLPTAQVPVQLSSAGPAAQAAWGTAWGTQPITAAAPAAWSAAMNAFGGVIRWVAAPQQEILVTGGVAADQQVSLENITGASVVTAQMLIEEI